MRSSVRTLSSPLVQAQATSMRAQFVFNLLCTARFQAPPAMHFKCSELFPELDRDCTSTTSHSAAHVCNNCRLFLLLPSLTLRRNPLEEYMRSAAFRLHGMR